MILPQDLKEYYDALGKKYLTEVMADVYGMSRSRENLAEGKTYAEGFWDKIFEAADRTQYICETEIKTDEHWHDIKFVTLGLPEVTPLKYRTMNTLDRKIKNLAEEFFIFSENGLYGWKVNVATWEKHRFQGEPRLCRMPGSNEMRLERFWEVDVKHGEFYIKENGVWHMWETPRANYIPKIARKIC